MYIHKYDQINLHCTVSLAEALTLPSKFLASQL